MQHDPMMMMTSSDDATDTGSIVSTLFGGGDDNVVPLHHRYACTSFGGWHPSAGWGVGAWDEAARFDPNTLIQAFHTNQPARFTFTFDQNTSI